MILPQLLKDSWYFATVPVFVLFFWRGVWELMDTNLYKGDLKSSAWASLLIGYVGLVPIVVRHLLITERYTLVPQSPTDEDTASWRVQHLIFQLRHRLLSIYISCCVVNSWRGLWLLQVLYLVPSDPVLSAWISAISGATVLLLLNHFKSTQAPPSMILSDTFNTVGIGKDLSPTEWAKVSLIEHDDSSEVASPSAKLVCEVQRGSSQAKCEIYLFGAHIFRWCTSKTMNIMSETTKENVDVLNHLWVSTCSLNDGTAPIRGGVPIAFPQFADEGELSLHGFARTELWHIVNMHTEGAVCSITLELTVNQTTKRLWDHSFVLRYAVELTVNSLRSKLTVTNMSAERAFEFSGCLHPYFRVADIDSATLRGLENCSYVDKTDGRKTKKQACKELHVASEVEEASNNGFHPTSSYFVDRIYYRDKNDPGNSGEDKVGIDRESRGLPNTLQLIDNKQKIMYSITKSASWPCWVVFNPWKEGKRGPSHPDFDDDGHRFMFCVEPAIANHKQITVKPLSSWEGEQFVVVSEL